MTHRPRSLGEALALVAAPDARALAGGQTLVAMMNLGLLEPASLVSLALVDELRGITNTGDEWRIGAMTTHAELAAREFTGGLALLADAARQIADPGIRNAGTIGGACAHGDPVSDWPATLVALDARIELQSTHARREVAAVDFFVDLLTTAAQPGELVTAVLVRSIAGRARYRKLARVHGDYATASVAAAGTRAAPRIAIGACGPRPVRVPAAESLVAAGRIDEAGALLAQSIDPIDDVRGTAAYRRRVLPAIVSDTVKELFR